MIVVLILFLIVFIVLLSFFSLGFTKIAIFLAWFYFLSIFIFFLIFLNDLYRVVFKNEAPYVRSRKKFINKVLQEINFKEDSLVFDLGCGNAKFLITLLKQKKVKAIGYEYFIIPFIIAWARSLFYKNLKVYHQDFFYADLSRADYVFCYLVPEQMDRLEEKLQKELKPGAIVISNTFSFKNWQKEKLIMLDQTKKHGLSNRIYIYRK